METMETKKECPNAYAGVAFGVIGTVVAFTLVAQFNRKKVQATNEFALIWAREKFDYRNSVRIILIWHPDIAHGERDESKHVVLKMLLLFKFWLT